MHKQVAEMMCARALDGTLSLEEFYQQWSPRPQGEKDLFWSVVYDDLEDGVQHTPGKWFAGKIDQEQWRKAWEYFVIYVDLLLVRTGGNPQRLLEVRNKALARKRMSMKEADDFVAAELSAG